MACLLYTSASAAGSILEALRLILRHAAPGYLGKSSNQNLQGGDFYVAAPMGLEEYEGMQSAVPIRHFYADGFQRHVHHQPQDLSVHY